MEVRVSLETIAVMLDDPFLHPAPGSKYRYGVCLVNNVRSTFQFTAIPGITFVVEPTPLKSMSEFITQE